MVDVERPPMHQTRGNYGGNGMRNSVRRQKNDKYLKMANAERQRRFRMRHKDDSAYKTRLAIFQKKYYQLRKERYNATELKLRKRVADQRYYNQIKSNATRRRIHRMRSRLNVRRYRKLKKKRMLKLHD